MTKPSKLINNHAQKKIIIIFFLTAEQPKLDCHSFRTKYQSTFKLSLDSKWNSIQE